MKNIIEICKDFGLEIPAEKHADFLKAVNSEYKTVAEHNKVLDKLSTVTKRAETAEETLKGFDGKDFESITKERDEWQRKHKELEESHKRETEEREFNDVLSAAITDAKGKSPKAIMALLELDKLRNSRNQEKDIKAALDSLRTESGYLFEDNGGKPAFTTQKDDVGKNGGTITKEEIMSVRDPVKRQKLIGENRHLFVKRS